MTKYMLRVEILATKRTRDEQFDTMTEREMFKIGYGPFVKVLAQWEAAV